MMTDINDEYAKKLNEVYGLLKTLAWAKECGLEYEFMVSFLEDYENTKSVPSAVWFATCEWDL
jgi:LAS superfamily LD-carboxypeptidase LdcB